jgi:tRNA(fMet)-specific endonuclease VapC
MMWIWDNVTFYVLDTNIISLILRRQPKPLTNFQTILTPNNIVIGCPVVWYELKRGLIAKDAKSQMQLFEALFETFIWQDFDQNDWLQAAALWAARRAQGLPVSDPDLLIGVFARNRNAILITDNEKDFVSLGVKTENWTL